MTDDDDAALVQRLRAAAAGSPPIEPPYSCYFDAVDGLFKEAADAIERLAEDLRVEELEHDHWHGLWEQAEAENARLRLLPSVEHCRAERAEGKGGCGACALCCKEANERREQAEAEAARLRDLVRDAEETMHAAGFYGWCGEAQAALRGEERP
jgi:hypothetical protein